jgi:hypothetical protein
MKSLSKRNNTKCSELEVIRWLSYPELDYLPWELELFELFINEKLSYSDEMLLQN